MHGEVDARHHRIHPAGKAPVKHAKATGMWDAMNDVDAPVVPDDLPVAIRLGDFSRLLRCG